MLSPVLDVWHVQAAPLLVNTRLTTGTVQGGRLGGTGSLMNDKGFAKCAALFLHATATASNE